MSNDGLHTQIAVLADRCETYEKALADQACPGCGRQRPHCDCLESAQRRIRLLEDTCEKAREVIEYMERQKYHVAVESCIVKNEKINVMRRGLLAISGQCPEKHDNPYQWAG